MSKIFENKIIPVLFKIGQNKRLIAIRNGLSITVPFTIIGSFFLIIGNLPVQAWMDFISPYSEILNAPVNVTFGMLGLISAIGIGYYMGKELEVEPISNALITLVAFLLATLSEENTLNIESLGAVGMFTAIIVSLFTVEVYRFFIRNNITIKMPDGVPPAVAQSFISLIPAFVIITAIWIIRVILGVDLNAVIQIVFQPLVFGIDSLPGLIITSLIVCLLWSAGIHGDHALAGIVTPIVLSNLAANMAAFQAGTPLPHIVVEGFGLVFMSIGGTGATIGLVLNMMRSKVKSYKSLGRLSLPSAVFNINEPVIFGFPIVMNPIMMIPFIITPVIIGSFAYVLTKLEIIGAVVFLVPWTTPPVIGAYLATNGNIPAAIFSALSVVASYFIYLPFFKVAEKKQLLLEQGETEEEVIAEVSNI
ncbi:PTS system, cellobiose-specific IIC component [Carnobacterium iners]|uniref:Permease IIC component n=1 Tax=Carnobacterium iners TaxID=1073423 RepID=A0A1X7MVD3_9LACT|nr:PTS transporter subunit EIIC [Carnobacterium iners]SEK55451.1 PTS system, cellobiose-specific IIC component [Carnobacterium iners]SMH28347.1 PTS system, cellobiose-specific IIC component [Carnobacterium iners]